MKKRSIFKIVLKYFQVYSDFWISYLEERPQSLLKLVLSRVDLLLAEVHEAARAQRRLQLIGALQKGRFRNNLTDMYNVCGGLLRLLRVRLRVLQGHQLPAKLQRRPRVFRMAE